jgi:hypothetical protein
LSTAPDISKSPPNSYLVPIYCPAIAEMFFSKTSRFFSMTEKHEALPRSIVKMNNIEMNIFSNLNKVFLNGIFMFCSSSLILG